MLLTLSLVNFILCILYALKAYMDSKLTLIFWFGSLFFFGIPNLIDCISITIGIGRELELYLSSQDINYIYDFEATYMTVMTGFVLCFNLLFALGEKKLAVITYTKKNFSSGQYEYLLIILNYLSLIIFLLTFEGEWFVADFRREVGRIFQITALLMAICTSASYNLAVSDRKFLALFNLLPITLLSFIISERPYMAPAMGVVFLWMAHSQENKISNLIKLILAGLASIITMKLVRMIANQQEINLLDMISTRDSSTSVLYWIFKEPEYYQALTSGKATLFLITTGLLPSSLFGDRDFSVADIPRILAEDRFNWDFGTIHPTLYGWIFIDLGYFAIPMAFVLGLVIAKLSNLTSKASERLYSLYIVCFSMFIFTAMRGSLQVAYSKAFYMFIIGVIIIYSYKALSRKFPTYY